MSLSVQVNGREIRVVDSDLGTLLVLPFSAGLSITRHVAGRITVAEDAVDQALPFGDITDAKIIVIKTDGAAPIAYKVNGDSATKPLDPLLLLTSNASGGYTSLSLTGDADEDVVVDYFIGE